MNANIRVKLESINTFDYFNYLAPSPRNDDDQNDQEVAAAFNFNKWLQETSKQIEIDPAQDINETASSESSVPDEELYNPPFGPRKTNHINVPEPMKNETNNDDVDDFFS